MRMTREIELADTDLAGVVHFSRLFLYFEAAERALFEHAGVRWLEMEPERLRGWPKVQAQCDYHAPVTFGEPVEIEARIERITARSVVTRFDLFQGTPPRRCASGSLTSVYARIDRYPVRLAAEPIPEPQRRLLDSQDQPGAAI